MKNRFEQVSRRQFVQLATIALGALSGVVPGCDDPRPFPNDGGMDAGLDAPVMPDAGTTGLPHLGGAPDTPDGRTIAAFVDTVIPGAFRDPTRAIGGIDVGAPALFFDPELPAVRLVPLLRLVLDGLAREVSGGRVFAAASFEQRDRALELGLMRLPELEFAVQLARLAFFSSREAGRALGYPGPNLGYVNDPDFSFRRPMAREITPDGNLS